MAEMVEVSRGVVRESLKWCFGLIHLGMSPLCRGAEFRRARAQRWEEAGLHHHTGDFIRGRGRGAGRVLGRAPHAAPLVQRERLEEQGCPQEPELQSAGRKGGERAALLVAESRTRNPATLAGGARLTTSPCGPGIQHLLSGETDHLEGL